MSEFAALRGLDELVDLAPALRRAVDLDAAALARLRVRGNRASVLIRLPFGVLVSRTLHTLEAVPGDVPHDLTAAAGEWLAWLEGDRSDPPQRRDAQWRGGTPPLAGWRRLDTVPDEALRAVVRSGARALAEGAERAGIAGAQPRAEVADALLDAVVLTVSTDDGSLTAELTLRTVSALVRMGFVPTGSQVAVDVAGRWVRIVGTYGTAYAERPGMSLGLL